MRWQTKELFNRRPGEHSKLRRANDSPLKPAQYDKASEAVLVLKPVTFGYQHELDPARIPQFGLVAEEMEKVDPHLVPVTKAANPTASGTKR